MSGTDATFPREMFELQANYLHQRLSREPWWGMDYGFGNFTQFKSICKFAPGVAMDLDDHAWRASLAECWNALQRHSDSAGPAAFVAFLWERWGARWLTAFPIFERGLLAEKYTGCFRYDFDSEHRAVHLHFHNLDAPLSPFAQPGKRREDLRRIIAEIEQQNLKPERVSFDSWMNHLKPIQELFPKSFAASLVKAEEFPKGYGWWGQFITRDGKMHERRAALLKEKGVFEFPRLNGACSWSDFRATIMA